MEIPSRVLSLLEGLPFAEQVAIVPREDSRAMTADELDTLIDPYMHKAADLRAFRLDALMAFYTDELSSRNISE